MDPAGSAPFFQRRCSSDYVRRVPVTGFGLSSHRPQHTETLGTPRGGHPCARRLGRWVSGRAYGGCTRVCVPRGYGGILTVDCARVMVLPGIGALPSNRRRGRILSGTQQPLGG
jgi:hypothetical protein